MSRNLQISFSGGETSAYLTRWCLANLRDEYDNIEVVFANTGQEHEETLRFVDRCDRHFGFNTTWVEAVVHHGVRKAPTHQIVDYQTASRDGTPFEESIIKYGIPNYKFKHCTRSLKTNPIESYAKSLGWDDWHTAIGIRIDEVDRVSSNAAKHGLIYPFVTHHPVTKQQVNSFWAAQPFRLELKQYQGNCVWCWKKTFRKHFTLISEDASVYDFPRRMEQLYPRVGPEFEKHDRKNDPHYRRTFFRGNKSVEDVFAEYDQVRDSFEPYHDEMQEFDPDFDVGGGCEESCEVFSDEDTEMNYEL